MSVFPKLNKATIISFIIAYPMLARFMTAQIASSCSNADGPVKSDFVGILLPAIFSFFLGGAIGNWITCCNDSSPDFT